MKNIINSKILFLSSLVLMSSIFSALISVKKLNTENHSLSKTKVSVGPYGGWGGSSFNDGNEGIVTRVYIRHGAYIDQIKTYNKGAWNAAHGGFGGAAATYYVPYGECITKILVRHGAYVDSLQFVTDQGKYSPKYGGNGGRLSTVNLPCCLRGIYGRSGAYVDQIGFYH